MIILVIGLYTYIPSIILIKLIGINKESKMTLIFEFIDVFSIKFVISIIFTFFSILANFFIYYSGKKQSDRINFSKLLIYGGIINIILEILIYFIPDISLTGAWPYQASEGRTLLYYTIFQTALFVIPPILTLGVFFIIVGKKNGEEFKVYILKGGILNTVSRTIYAVFVLLSEIMFTLWVLGIIPISTLLFSVSSIPVQIIFWSQFVLGVLFFIFLILHGRKFDEKYLKYAGILFLVNAIVDISITYIINLIYILIS